LREGAFIDPLAGALLDVWCQLALLLRTTDSAARLQRCARH
jgi:hypothetical protein